MTDRAGDEAGKDSSYFAPARAGDTFWCWQPGCKCLATGLASGVGLAAKLLRLVGVLPGQFDIALPKVDAGES